MNRVVKKNQSCIGPGVARLNYQQLRYKNELALISAEWLPGEE